jgi:hypothetical protein
VFTFHACQRDDIPTHDVIIIIIFINCNWVLTRWQWLFYMYTNTEKKVTREFKSGGLHERHVVQLGNVEWILKNRLFLTECIVILDVTNLAQIIKLPPLNSVSSIRTQPITWF